MRRKFLLLGALCICAVGAVLIAFFVTESLFFRIFPEAPSALRENALSFLTGIVGFNLTEYEIIHTEYAPSTDVVSRSGQLMITLSYTLQSALNKVHVVFDYTRDNDNYTLESYSQIYLDSPAFVYPPYPADNLLNWTKSFIERYKILQSDSTYISEMQKILGAVDTIEPLNRTSGNIKLQVSIRQFNPGEIYTSITFLYTSEGVDYYSKMVQFDFHNGLYMDFADMWNKVRIGNDHVVIQQAEAQNLAWQEAESFAQEKFGNETAGKLQSTPRLIYLSAEYGGNNSFYPMWRIEFSFKEQFYSATDAMTISYIEVGIWAYNKEVVLCRAL